MPGSNVMIYCATWRDANGNLAVRPETMRAIKALRARKVVFGTENPYPGYDYRNVLAQYQKAWQLALDGGYHLLTIEHDIVPPADTIRKLATTPANVAFGVYVFRSKTKRAAVINAYRWKPGISEPDISISLFPKGLEHARQENIVRVSGVGWGCTLIKHEVLKQIGPRGERDADLHFATDCIRAGIPMYARFDVICGHIHEGEELRPFETMQYCAIEALDTFRGATPNGSKFYKKGLTYKAPLSSVEDWERAGFVRRLEE